MQRQVYFQLFLDSLKYDAKIYRMTQKKRELLKNPAKIEEIQEKNLLTEIEPLQLAF